MSTRRKYDRFWKKRRPTLNASGDDDIHYDDIYFEYDDYNDYDDICENINNEDEELLINQQQIITDDGDEKCNEEETIINTSSSPSERSLLFEIQRDEMSIHDGVTIGDDDMVLHVEMDVVDGIFMDSSSVQSLLSNGGGILVDDSSFSMIAIMMEEEDDDWDVITTTATDDDILIPAPNSKHNMESFSIDTSKCNDSEWDALSSIQSIISIGDMDHDTHMMISSSSSVDYGSSYKDIISTKSKIMSGQTRTFKHDDDYVENLNATTIVKNDLFMSPIVEEDEEDCCVSLNYYSFDERDGYKFGRGGKNPYNFRRKKKTKTMATSKRESGFKVSSFVQKRIKK